MRCGKFFYALVVFLMLSSVMGQAAAYSSRTKEEVVIVNHRHSSGNPFAFDSLVKVGVGFFSFCLLIISVLSYLRDKRMKFLIVCLAFFMFSIKGLFGLIDLFFPSEVPLLVTVSDVLDLIILMLLFAGVVKK